VLGSSKQFAVHHAAALAEVSSVEIRANGGNECVLGRSKSVGRVLHINNLPDFWVPVKGFLRKTIQKVR
jgi:hypothetical protein